MNPIHRFIICAEAPGLSDAELDDLGGKGFKPIARAIQEEVGPCEVWMEEIEEFYPRPPRWGLRDASGGPPRPPYLDSRESVLEYHGADVRGEPSLVKAAPGYHCPRCRFPMGLFDTLAYGRRGRTYLVLCLRCGTHGYALHDSPVVHVEWTPDPDEDVPVHVVEPPCWGLGTFASLQPPGFPFLESEEDVRAYPSRFLTPGRCFQTITRTVDVRCPDCQTVMGIFGTSFVEGGRQFGYVCTACGTATRHTENTADYHVISPGEGLEGVPYEETAT